VDVRLFVVTADGPRRGDVTDAAAGVAAERDRLAVKRLLAFFKRYSGRWKTPTGEAWQPALAIDAVVNTYERTRDITYLKVIEKSFARYRGRRSHYYDDDGWYLNAWLRAYDVTGDRKYLDEAQALFAGMTQAWDDVCGGGLWWNKDRGYKNAITNELFLLAAARLHRRAGNGTGDGSYHDWALREWNWFNASGMINSSHLVNDGLDGSCANNGRTTWSYNQGVILGGLVELWRITGDGGYLVRARQIADAAIDTLVDADSILKDPGEPERCSGDALIFKGIFVQGLARLYNADRASRPAYWAFLNANADSVWNASRGWRNGIGSAWAGPAGRPNAATQASASLLLGGIALLHAGGETDRIPASHRDNAAIDGDVFPA
jgi:predicted alpha-1,6-mannanase (GH76 family)